MLNLPPNRHPFEVQAIHLRSYPFDENNLVAVLFTREYGVLRAVARGVRKPKSRLAGLISPLRCNHLILKSGRNLHSISQAENIHSFSAIQQDYDKLMVGLAIGELVSQFCQESDAQPELYDALLATLHQLCKHPEPRHLMLWFMLYFLELQGYFESWEQCQSCGKEVKDHLEFYQNVLEGGLRCKGCKQSPDHRYVSSPQLRALQFVHQSPQTPELELNAKDTNQLIWNLQQQFQHLVGHELKTFSFLYPMQTL